MIIAIGLLLVVGGLIYYFFGDKLKWIGNLPGDIKIDNGNTKVYFPITTMILLSVVLNVVFRIIQGLK